MDNHTELLTSLRHGQNGGSTNSAITSSGVKEREREDMVSFAEQGISVIPDEYLEQLQRAEVVSLRHNSLNQLPAWFKFLQHLRVLDLSGNRFTVFPAVLLQCGRLEKLDLSNNAIAQLPLEFPERWGENIVSLSLRNNKLTLVKQSHPMITQLKHLRFLDLDGNSFQTEVLEKIFQGLPKSKCSPEEYWVLALKKYFGESVPAQPPLMQASVSTTESKQKIARAAKRMGFIANSHSSDDNDNSIITSPSTDFDLDSHSKFSEYFKRLSVLPEEPNLPEIEGEAEEQNYKELLQTHHEKKRKSMENVVLACRKLLFTFTECQHTVRKIISLCSDKTISVNIVSQLYSLKTHIDNLVEVLEQFESNSSHIDSTATQAQFLHHDVLIRLCLTIISIFKKTFNQLRKDFDIFFGNNDIFFIRVFYMNIMCSYTEIYNAWDLLSADNYEMMKKKKLTRTHSLHTSSIVQHQKITNNRQKSTTALNRSPSLSGPTYQASTNLNSQTANALPVNPSIQQITPPLIGNSFSSTPLSTSSITPPISDSSPKAGRSTGQIEPGNTSGFSQGATSADVSTISAQTTSAETDIDSQLYHTLNAVIDMVNVVYSQLTHAITKSAILSTSSDQLSITPAVAAKTKDLTDTCYQSMDLSKILRTRLAVITSNDLDTYLATKEKAKTWEDINAFLKSIIAILANTKQIMSDLPTLNDVRPNLASLAKITKDVTVILDLSSYKSVSISSQQTAPSANTTSNNNNEGVHSNQHSSVIQQSPAGGQGEASDHMTSNIITPLSTPSLVTSHNVNPFDQL